MRENEENRMEAPEAALHPEATVVEQEAPRLSGPGSRLGVRIAVRVTKKEYGDRPQG